MKKTQKNDLSTSLSAAICVICCALLLGAIASDGTRYKEDAVSAAITYTEPVHHKDQGFWELFSNALVGLFDISE